MTATTLRQQDVTHNSSRIVSTAGIGKRLRSSAG